MKKLLCFLSCALMLLSLSAQAHLTYPSEIRLDISGYQAYMEIRIPVDDLLLALPDKLSSKPIEVLLAEKNDLLAYLYAHMNAYIGNHEHPLELRVESLSLIDINQTKRLLVTTKITQTNGEQLGNFLLHYTALSHKVINHKTLVVINSDFENAQLTAQTEPFGIFDYQHEDLVINRSQGSQRKGTWEFVHLGMVHIDEGLDHLAFILGLLLIAPLRLINKNWAFANTRDTVFSSLKLVSLFTLGHTITLILVSFNILIPNPALIEILICATIMLTAIHALKPLPLFNETLAALLFGLIHGAAFSETLKEFHFSTMDFALSLAGFNLGIELAQIIAIALLLPWLLMLRYILPQQLIKNGLSTLLLCISTYWLYQRITGQTSAPETVSGLRIYFKVASSALILLTLISLPVMLNRAKKGNHLATQMPR